MAGRPCTICNSSEKQRIAADMIAAGATDQAIADRIGGVNRMAVSRHRHNHVIVPVPALAEAAGKGKDAADQRAQAMAVEGERSGGVRRAGRHPSNISPSPPLLRQPLAARSRIDVPAHRWPFQT